MSNYMGITAEGSIEIIMSNTCYDMDNSINQDKASNQGWFK